jgi:hypothetical protein
MDEIKVDGNGDFDYNVLGKKFAVIELEKKQVKEEVKVATKPKRRDTSDEKKWKI